MYKDKKVVVVLPAYNASRTLPKTYAEIPHDLVDEIILCDDASKDNTVEIARTLGIEHILQHEQNRGYGGNQKTLYKKALEINGDIIIMLHPDYQYTPLLIPSMVNIIGENLYPVVLGSRILGKGALQGGMPIYKYWANRFLTFSKTSWLIISFRNIIPVIVPSAQKCWNPSPLIPTRMISFLTMRCCRKSSMPGSDR